MLDTVGGDTTTRSVASLKRGGRLVTIAGRLPTAECDTAGVACKGASVDDDAATLQQIAELFGAGTLKVNVEAELPLERVGEAHELNRLGHTRGKIVIKVGATTAEATAGATVGATEVATNSAPGEPDNDADARTPDAPGPTTQAPAGS